MTPESAETPMASAPPLPPTTVRLRDLGDVLAVLPYQLGYHPEDSVLAVSLHGTRVGMVARLDLTFPEDVDEAAATMVGPVAAGEPDQVLLVAYESVEEESAALLAAIEDELATARIPVLDRVVVRAGRWYAGACGPRGAAVPAPADVPAVADFVALGRSPVSRRTDLTARVRPVDRTRVDAVARHLASWRGAAPGRREPVVDAVRVWARVLDPAAPEPGPRDTALAARSLRDVEVRDALIGLLCPGTLPREALDPEIVDLLLEHLPDPYWGPGSAATGRDEVSGVVERLCAVSRTLPEHESAPALTVLANLLWWVGDGAMARTALDRALDCEPGYRLAGLLLQLVDNAIRPHGRGRPGSEARTRSA